MGAFAECSSDIHLLLREAARSAAMRHWRQVGAASIEAAIATNTRQVPPPLGS